MADPHWLEVSMTVDPELAEAVAELLSRFVSNGVVVESGVIYKDAEDEGTPIGPVRVFGYLAIDEFIEENRARLEESLWHLGQIQALPEASFKTIEDEDWMSSWKQHYHPIQIGSKLLVLPAWLEEPPGGRIAIRIDPSMAFGTGTHPTTQLCLELLESAAFDSTGQPVSDVIDVGCGSGILSIGAVKLGVPHALAVDIDNTAVRSTRENSAANGVLARIETGMGSVNETRAGQFSIQAAPLVLANILAPVIIRLFDAGLSDLVLPGGKIVLSGILDEQAQSVIQAGEAHGLTFIEQRQITDWVAILMQK